MQVNYLLTWKAGDVIINSALALSMTSILRICMVSPVSVERWMGLSLSMVDS